MARFVVTVVNCPVWIEGVMEVVVDQMVWALFVVEPGMIHVFVVWFVNDMDCQQNDGWYWNRMNGMYYTAIWMFFSLFSVFFVAAGCCDWC